MLLASESGFSPAYSRNHRQIRQLVQTTIVSIDLALRLFPLQSIAPFRETGLGGRNLVGRENVGKSLSPHAQLSVDNSHSDHTSIGKPLVPSSLTARVQ